MKKSMVLLCVCVVALAALIAVMMLTGDKGGGEGAAADASAQPAATEESYELFALNSDDITGIKITTREGETIGFNRDREGNWIFAGGDNPVKQSDLKSMALSISGLTGTRKISDGKDDLSSFGLDKPRAIAEATYSDGAAAVIRIGDPTPTGSSYYVMAEGTEGVYLANQFSMERFLRARADYVDKSISLPALDTLQHIYIAEKDRPVIEFQIGEQVPIMGGDPIEALIMTSPLPDASFYSENFNTSFYQNVSDIKLGDIVDMAPSDLSAYGLNAPVLQLRFEGTEVVYGLTVGSDYDPDNAYAMADGKPEVYLVSKDSLKPLLDVNPMRYTESFISLMSIDLVDRMLIEADGKTNEIQMNREIIKAQEEGKQDETILHPTVNGKEIQEGGFKIFYRIIIALKYDVITEPAEASGQPSVTVTYELNNGEGAVTDKYYNYDENFYIVEHNGIVKNLINKKAVNDMLAAIPKVMEGAYDR